MGTGEYCICTITFLRSMYGFKLFYKIVWVLVLRDM